MTRRILFVQGGGESTHDEWDNKLVESLKAFLGSDYEIHYPRMPDESDPSYARWKESLERELSKLGDGTIVVGHSVGATILINAIAADPPKLALGGIFLIAAPFVGNEGWPSDGFEPQKELGSHLPNGVAIYLYHGGEDETVPLAHVELYARAIPQAVIRRLEGRDHQLNNDLSEVARDIQALA